MSYYRTYYRT